MEVLCKYGQLPSPKWHWKITFFDAGQLRSFLHRWAAWKSWFCPQEVLMVLSKFGWGNLKLLSCFRAIPAHSGIRGKVYIEQNTGWWTRPISWGYFTGLWQTLARFGTPEAFDILTFYEYFTNATTLTDDANLWKADMKTRRMRTCRPLRQGPAKMFCRWATLLKIRSQTGTP